MVRLIALLTMIALPVAAHVPEPPCGIDEGDGSLWPITEARDLAPIWPARHRGEVVTYEWVDVTDRVHGYIQLCQTGEALRYAIANEATLALSTRLGEMLDSDRVHSLRDVRRMIRGLGGEASLGHRPGPCACEAWTR